MSNSNIAYSFGLNESDLVVSGDDDEDWRPPKERRGGKRYRLWCT